MMRATLVRAAVITALAGTLLVTGVASAKPQSAASPPVWSHHKFSVHWGASEFFFDDQGGLVYAIADLIDSADNLVGSVKDTYHADGEEWAYTYYWPGTTDVAGTFYVPLATSDPHPASNRASPGPAGQLYTFAGVVTEATGVFGEDGPMPLVGALAEMNAEVGLDGSFGCVCTLTRPACPACKPD